LDATRRLPPELVEHARAFLGGDTTPVTPKDASTVVLLRDTRQGPEVYLLRRHRQMAFAAGMYAFPGGTVDARDSDRAVAWSGPSPAEWASALDCDEAQARALVCAAVRETFEESGVLLAGTTKDSLVGDTTGTEWERDRAALVDRSLAFVDFLSRRELVVRTDLLHPWAHWITPEFEPRRYDTRFFVAALPAGQVTRDVSTESDKVVWMKVRDVIDAVDDGELAMLPPTYATCLELYELRTAEEAIRAADLRDRSPVLPHLQIDDQGGDLRLPHHLVALGERVAARRTAAR
jgi:8-oxo-dGTP pyrophosphatase MutT (NUDIX family)